ncbi:hypothetical protein Agub_g1819 [Astrephomene gubernaculifera]|uniref:Kinesin motor domain-containing protein n=1 Tax=Astrephomene gubernaculifera TaxID=47775 RepID=A0AAD3DG41_9CHLO|nr:hypothetical protein Agub_g1819 [Astrephomene gubernaculifera]
MRASLLTPFRRSARGATDESSDASDSLTPKAMLGRSLPLRHSHTGIRTSRPGALHESSTTIKKRSSGGGDAVKVFVRVKPIMEEDIRTGRAKDTIAIHDRDGKLGIAIPAANGKENWFTDFDGVLDNSTNQQLFEAVGGGLMPQLLGGINVSIMAYGQTGSGKTYSMFGCDEPDIKAQGLLHMVLHKLDESVCLGSPRASLSISVFEVYNEELFCLLDAASVERRSLSKGMSDYHQHKPRQMNNVDEAIALVLEALQNRARDATVRNATSSRSHAFVRMRLEQSSLLGTEEQALSSTLFLVDLAGSENINNANSSTQQKETININSSLNALERVVNALCTRSPHVPYRDSLLTQVLQEGLDPYNARVALITTVSRFQCDATVSKGTLMFAQRARNVRTYAVANVAPKRPSPACPEELQRQLQALQAINNKLRQQLADLEASHERQSRERHAEAMRDELTRLTELHNELRRTSARHQAEAEAALEAERSAHAATRTQLEEAERSKAEVQVMMGAAAEEARRTTADLRAQLAEARLEAARLHGELAGARALAEQVQEQHKAAQQHLMQAKDLVTSLKGQLASVEMGANQENQELKQQITKLRADAVAARNAAASEVSGLQQRVHSLQQQLEQAKQAYERQAQELIEAREQATQAQRRLTEVEQGATQQVAALQQQLEGAKSRSEQQTAQIRRLEGDLAGARDQAGGEVERLRQQLAEKAAAMARQGSMHSAALAAAVQEARAASEAAAAQQIVPLQTECERLRATCTLSEEQMTRLQAECERLREAGGAASEQVMRLQAECAALREAAHRAEVEASERVAKLEAQIERDAAPRRDTFKQMQERVRQLEAEKKRDEADHRGQLELKEKLVRQLELINSQLQSEVARLKQDTVVALLSDQVNIGSPYTALPHCGSRCDMGCGSPTDDVTPLSSANITPAPSRGPSNGGMLLLNRTTTGSAAALARNTRGGKGDGVAPHPPAPRHPGSSAAAGAANPAQPPSEGGAPEVINLVTPVSTPGPPEPRLTPTHLSPLEQSLLALVQEQQTRPNHFTLRTNAVRNRMNY